METNFCWMGGYEKTSQQKNMVMHCRLDYMATEEGSENDLTKLVTKSAAASLRDSLVGYLSVSITTMWFRHAQIIRYLITAFSSRRSCVTRVHIATTTSAAASLRDSSKDISVSASPPSGLDTHKSSDISSLHSQVVTHA
eukprot:4703743-Amphidinium_carterae.2